MQSFKKRITKGVKEIDNVEWQSWACEPPFLDKWSYHHSSKEQMESSTENHSCIQYRDQQIMGNSAPTDAST